MDSKELMQSLKLENLKEPIQNSSVQLRQSKPAVNSSHDIFSLMRRYGIPPRFINMDFVGNLDMGLVESGVCLTGETGTGKTMAISLMVRDWLIKKTSEPGLSFYDSWRFISFPEFIMEIQDSFRNREDSAYEMLKEVVMERRLIIDDLGAEKTTEYVRQATYYIINHREMNLLPTFITTNFSMDYLNENIDPRISSRICGMCEVIRLEGLDRRIRKVL